MKLSDVLRHGLSLPVLVMVFLFLATACGASGEPTPTPEPELTLEWVLESAGGKLAAMSTAKFEMIDEMESGAQFFRTTLKSVEGEIRSPDAARMLVDVEAPAMGFVEIEILAVKDLAYMKFFKDAPWAPLPIEQVPFNFGGIGIALSELLPIIRDAAITGLESIEGVQTIRIEGNIVSEELSDLITSVDSGHPITLTFWIGAVDHTLRQLTIAGKIFNGDAPETRRRVIIRDINLPVDIQLPDIATGP